MEYKLAISGIFRDEQEMRETVRKRRICYDSEPYYNTDNKGRLVQIGYQLNLYGTFPPGDERASPDDAEFSGVLRDVRRVAQALSNTCNPLHMCEGLIVDSDSVTYAREREMRPDVTVHVPIFDQQNFGHPVDLTIEDTLHMAGRVLEAAGVRRIRWIE